VSRRLTSTVKIYFTIATKLEAQYCKELQSAAFLYSPSQWLQKKG